MIVAAVPLEPPEGEACFRLCFTHDGPRPVASIVVESVDYEWGDQGNEKKLDIRLGPVAPGATVELMKESDTELRTSLTLRVDGRRVYAEFGKLTRGRGEKRATLTVLEAPAGTVDVDDQGARRWLTGGRSESVSWSELVKVELMTTDQGPWAMDVFWVLHGADEKGCVLPQDVDGLLERLQALPGFDNEAVIRAMASSANARFLAWVKPA